VRAALHIAKVLEAYNSETPDFPYTLNQPFVAAIFIYDRGFPFKNFAADQGLKRMNPPKSIDS